MIMSVLEVKGIEMWLDTFVQIVYIRVRVKIAVINA